MVHYTRHYATSNLSTPRHILQLRRASHLTHPPNPLRSKQLRLRLRALNRTRIIHHAHLNNPRIPKRLALAEQRATAIAAEVRCDLLPAVGFLGDGLGRAGDELELVAWDDDVGAVCRAGDLAAVGAVAEGLEVSWMFSFGGEPG